MAEEEKKTTATPESGAPEASTPAARRRKKAKKKFVTTGQAHILASYNNTIITLTDQQGNAIGWSSAGKVGFKGPKKSTPYAAGVVVRELLERVKDVGLKEVDVRVQGVGSGREAAIRALHVNGLAILSIKDVTAMPHNGPRPKKVRRV